MSITDMANMILDASNEREKLEESGNNYCFSFDRINKGMCDEDCPFQWSAEHGYCGGKVNRRITELYQEEINLREQLERMRQHE